MVLRGLVCWRQDQVSALCRWRGPVGLISPWPLTIAGSVQCHVFSGLDENQHHQIWSRGSQPEMGRVPSTGREGDPVLNAGVQVPRDLVYDQGMNWADGRLSDWCSNCRNADSAPIRHGEERCEPKVTKKRVRVRCVHTSSRKELSL